MSANIKPDKNVNELEDYFGTFDEECIDDTDDIQSNVNQKKEKKNLDQGSKQYTNDVKPVYENKEMYSMQNELLGYIPVHRFKWYIRKGLCTVLNENAIMLNFEPSFKNEKVVIDKDKNGPKENICVVCGTDRDLKRGRVLPYEIKKLLPWKYKAHKSSDVVVVCDSCSGDLDFINREFKLELYERYQIDPENFKIDSKSRTISSAVEKIIEENYVCSNVYTAKTLEQYFGKVPENKDLDDFLSTVKNFKYEGFKHPEEQLVDKVVKEDKVNEFVTEWKHNFFNNLQPEYLQWDFWNNDL